MNRQRTHIFPVWVLFGLVLLSSAQPLYAKPHLPPWENLANQFIEGYFALHPPFAVQAGRHDFDGGLPDWSKAGLLKQKQWLESERTTANLYDEAKLSLPQRFERKYLIGVIQQELFWLESAQAPIKNPMFYSEALDPNVYVSRPYAPIEQRIRAFTKYARNIPKAAAQIRGNLHLPLPRTYIDVGKTLFGGLAKFYGNDAKATFASVADQKLQREFAAAQQQATKAMLALADWLDSQRSKATDDFALRSALFLEMLQATERVDVPLVVLEKTGRQDLDRNMAALRVECGRFAPKLPLSACVEKVEAHKPSLGSVAEARNQLVALKAFVANKAIVSIPGAVADASVAESPPYKRWNTAYIDIPGPFESGLPAIYYVAPPDPAWSAADQKAYVPSIANLLFISAHEVWPGHFLQYLHAKRASSKFGQLFTSYAFSEGWAHYTEELMWESDLNAGDPETHIGQLLNALIRNVRFLSALGLHTQGMTLETAERMFRELAFRDAGTARQQAARGTFDPAYLNYTLGKLMIRKLRDDWTATRGGRSAWQSFHDAFLSYGAPPIPLVRKAMSPGKSGSDL